MNREILFRGKRIDTGEWVEGSFMTDYVHHKSGASIVQGGVVWCEVIPETVGQYTGLKDKNGVKIFEGDILEYKYHTFSPPNKADSIKIIHSNGVEFVDEDGVGIRESLGDIRKNMIYHVIGNVHDNPELL